jgi:hypothetical protein
LSYYFTSCVEAGPKKCVLAAQNKTAAELERDVWDFLDSVRNAPIAAGTTIIDLAGIKGFILGALKSTLSWPVMAEVLSTMVYGSKEEKGLAVLAIGDKAMDEVDFHSLGPIGGLWGIHCGDRIVRSESFEEVAPTFAKLRGISRLQGDAVDWMTAHCAQWPWRAKETYMGDFRVKTKNPILVVSNTRDSHTPLRSALNVSSGFEGSGLLEVNGTGVSDHFTKIPFRFSPTTFPPPTCLTVNDLSPCSTVPSACPQFAVSS